MKRRSRRIVSKSNNDKKKSPSKSRQRSELIDWSLDIDLIKAF
jgi:hypothetical protein